MNSLLEGVQSILKYKSRPIVIDNYVFRLHYRQTTLMLAMCAMLVTSKQLFGEPIKCTAVNKRKVSNEMLDTFCWTHTTFSVKRAWTMAVGEQVIYPGVINSNDKGDLIHHAYYQWVALVLFIQALFFYFPHQLWKSTFGYKIIALIPDELRDAIAGEEERRDKVNILASNLLKNCGRGNNIRYIYLLTQLLNLLNVMMQLYLMDRFLGGNFINYGRAILHFTDWGYSSHYDLMLRTFPRMTKCTFHSYGDSGDITKDDALCLLPINVLNEKIYLLLWFWLYFLLSVTAMTLLYQLISVLLSPFAKKHVAFRCSSEFAGSIATICRFFSPGDMFVLSFVRNNINRSDFEDLLRELYSLYSEQLVRRETWRNSSFTNGSLDSSYLKADHLNRLDQTPV